jgi:DNA-binding response OmpR family regulator
MNTEGNVPLAPATTPPAPLRVLLVEDDEMVAFSLAALLRQKGHRVDVARTGQAALEAASVSPPHLALVDLGLPDMDGYQVAGRFRGQDALREVMLVALTGWSDDESRRLGREAGFACHLIKPVDFDGLRNVLALATTVTAGGSIS